MDPNAGGGGAKGHAGAEQLGKQLLLQGSHKHNLLSNLLFFDGTELNTGVRGSM